MNEAALTVVHKRQAPVHKTARAVLSSASADSQRGCHVRRLVPTTHGDSGGITKLAGGTGLLQQSAGLMFRLTVSISVYIYISLNICQRYA